MINKSNFALKVNGNNFESIDEETRNAIVGDIAMYLMISYSDAEDIAMSLYYESYYDGNELRVGYSLPNILVNKCLYK